MGFFDKLLWGGSKRFANDVTKSVEKNRDIKQRNKVDTFNLVSEDIYLRRNFVYDCKSLISEIIDNLLQDDYYYKNEIPILEKLTDYYHKEKKRINELWTAAVPSTVDAEYSQFLRDFDETLTYIDKFIQLRQWELEIAELDSIYKKNELLEKRLSGEISKDEYNRILDSMNIDYPKNPLRGTSLRAWPDILRKTNESETAMIMNGDKILNKLRSV